MLAQSEDKVRADVTFADGVESVSFDTLEGRVEVDLPDDVSDSDTISGTVVAEPKGETREEFVKNEDELSGYVVEIAKTQEVKEPPQLSKAQEEPEKETSPIEDKPLQPGSVPAPTIKKTPPEIKLSHYKENPFSCLVPPAAGKITIVLKKPDGREVCRKDVRCAPAKPKSIINASHPPKCQFPQAAICGKAISIPGTCDGRSATSRVKINNRKCRVLAESPRRQIIRAPKEGAGKCNIESSECGFVRRGTIVMKPAVASVASISRPTSSPASSEKKTDLSGQWEATCTDHGIAVTTDGVTQNYPGQGQMPASLVNLLQQGNQLTWTYPGQMERTSETKNLAVTYFTGTLAGDTADLYWKNQLGTSKYNYVMKLRYDPGSDTIDAEGVFHTTVWNGYSISRSSCKLRRAGATTRPVQPPPRPRPQPKNGVWILQSVTPRFRWSTLDYKHSTVHCEPKPRYYSNPAAVTLSFSAPPERIRRGDQVSLRVSLMSHGQGFPVVGQANWLVFGFTNTGSYSSAPGNESAKLPERPQNVGQFLVNYPPANLPDWSSDASIKLGWVGNSTNEDITWKYKWMPDGGGGSTESQPSPVSSTPQATPRFESTVTQPTRTAPPVVPQQPEDKQVSYTKGEQRRWLRDMRQLEFDRVIAVMLGNSGADANARAETLRRNNDASAAELTKTMARLDDELRSSGRTVGYVNYTDIVNRWNRTIDLNQIPPQLQAQLDTERQQKMHELSAVERRNPKLAMQMAIQWRDGLVTWMKNQLDSLQRQWGDADIAIQNACTKAASRRQVDYVSFTPVSGAVDLTNEVLNTLQTGR
jgi:hypothetical protein